MISLLPKPPQKCRFCKGMGKSFYRGKAITCSACDGTGIESDPRYIILFAGLAWAVLGFVAAKYFGWL